MWRFGKQLEMFGEKYAQRTDLELLRQEMITLGTRVSAAELEVAEIYDKAYAALKRLEMRQRREPPAQVPMDLPDDPITAEIHARREAHRALHAEQG